MTVRTHLPSFNVSDNTGQFKIAKKSYTQQFSQIYFARLQALRPLIIMQSGGLNYIGRVLDVKDGQECLIVGTIFCENIERPDIFEEVENDQISLISRKAGEKYVKQVPLVYLEDESGRIELCLNDFEPYEWVTGITIGLLGVADAQGKFKVKSVVEAGIPHCPQRRSVNTDSYIALVSGLHYGSNEGTISSTRSLLAEFLNGDIFPEISQKIRKLVLLGNNMSAPIKVSNEFKKKYGHEIARYRTDHLQHLDRELGSIASALSTEIMPGEADLSTSALPQKPVPKALFLTLAANDSVNFTTNPSLIDVDSTKLLLSSGQTLDDIYRHVICEDRLTLLEKTLHWRNIAPTCPDTLFCYPFYDKDPFILCEAPHVYAVGNQPKFESRVVKAETSEIRTILVPDFSKSSSIVLLNLRDLSCSEFKLLY